ncbi:MAG: type II toxin-antitoxin system HicB family antitoxin [Spirochaetaceae bacterium]|nr:MAG: type II toxin-antitoxin system HicB family antitoxin [Spirochaetaceae bacterium]
MIYHFRIHNDIDGFWAECIELPGCMTQADSLKKLHINSKEVLDLYLDEPENSRIVFPLPDESIEESDAVIGVKADSAVAFAFYLRMIRLNHKLTQRDAAKMLHFKNLYSYQRLESSKKANPELKTLEKIREVFPEFDLNLVV